MKNICLGNNELKIPLSKTLFLLFFILVANFLNGNETNLKVSREIASDSSDCLSLFDKLFLGKKSLVRVEDHYRILESIKRSELSDEDANQLLLRLKGDKLSEEQEKLKSRIIKSINAFSGPKTGLNINYNIFRDMKNTEDIVVAMELLDSKEHLSGFMIFRIQSINKPKESIVNLDFIKLENGNPLTKGISDDLRKIYIKLGKSFGIKKVTLEADWLGRYVWAKKNFKFKEGFYYKYNGESLTQIQLARKNLKNFMRHYKINEKDLAIKGPHGLVDINSFDELKAPSDFANLVTKSGQMVGIHPYIDEGIPGEYHEMELGKAFLLGFYDPRLGQVNVISLLSDELEKFSDIHMPYWFGYRHL